ncbi:MAG: toprim domain-containing protein, partial [Selenomonadaceae bacterium]|nr:toprim domain-containing protein [Selenomonadaceae bacterium]
MIRAYLDKDATDLYAASFLMSDEEDDGSNDDADEENVALTVDYNFDDEDDDDELIDPPELKDNKKVEINLGDDWRDDAKHVADEVEGSPAQNTDVTHTDAFYYEEAEILRAKVTDAELAKIKAMSYDERGKLMIEINQLDLRNIFPLDRQGKGFICPVCSNGSGHSGDGIKPIWNESDGGYFWHNCLSHQDFQGKLTDLISSLNNLKGKGNWYKVLAIGQKILDYAESSSSPTFNFEKYSTQKEMSPEEIALIKTDLRESQANIDNLPQEDRRGLSVDTLQQLHFGYIAQWIHPKNRLDEKKLCSSRRIIIPTSENSYTAVLPKLDRNEKNKKYRAMFAGTKDNIFNAAAISTAKTNIIVEGEFDAASVFQVAGDKVNICAIGGTGNQENLMKFLDAKFTTKEEKLQLKFIVLMDNDDAGIKASKDLTAALIKNGFPATADFLVFGADKVDANDILCQQGDDALRTRIEQIIADSHDKISQVKENISASNVADKNADDSDTSLYSQLKEIQKKLADFEAEQKNAIERLKNLENFDSESVFAEEITNAAAFAKLFDRKIYSDFIRAVKLYGDEHPEEKAAINDLKAVIKDYAEIISY